ncbi:MAG: hypothetical protein R3E79_24060 [Caldilineaceae bacterium]
MNSKAQGQSIQRNARLNWQQAQQRADRLQSGSTAASMGARRRAHLRRAAGDCRTCARIVPIGLLLDTAPPDDLRPPHHRADRPARPSSLAQVALGHHPRCQRRQTRLRH